jgi:hypothetical protein
MRVSSALRKECRRPAVEPGEKQLGAGRRGRPQQQPMAFLIPPNLAARSRLQATKVVLLSPVAKLVLGRKSLSEATRRRRQFQSGVRGSEGVLMCVIVALAVLATASVEAH